MKFIDVPKKNVEFEDGHTVIVYPFSISIDCVTVGEFSDFQEATGYVARCEQGSNAVYNDNILNSSKSPIERLQSTAFYMSYVDAEAFCDWANFRLPTEAEWLAASIIDDVIYNGKAGEQPTFCDKFGNLLVTKMPPHLNLHGNEITSTIINSHVILRNAPMYYRELGWDEEVRGNRIARALDITEFKACFRVCKTE